MLLAELCDQLLPLWKPSRQKDVKSAVGYLAKALDCPDPQHCSLEHYNQPLITLYRRIEDYQRAQSKSPHIIRNTKNVISKLFRLAEEHHLLSLVPLVMTPSYSFKDRPRRLGAILPRRNGTSLPYAQWPSDLQDAFTTFQTWATAPVTPGRPAKLRKRLVTLKDYRVSFEGYFGYLHHQVHRVPTFDDLFDLELVTAYVHWHVNEYRQSVTSTIHEFLKDLCALIRQYRPDEQLRTKLVALKKTLPIPPPFYDKTDSWVSLADLAQVGRALWPRKLPREFSRRKDCDHPGLFSAIRAGISLMLQLWIHRPYRQRNMREMRLHDNLYKDTQGHWRIRFQGEQLKTANKRGKTNVFDLPFPSHLVPVLEDYLALWRPMLLAKAAHPDTHVFLTQCGTPYDMDSLGQTTRRIVYRYTGKHWHPHIIRTVWATEQIENGLDFLGVAKMLNDRLETVIANYAHLRDEDVSEKADLLIHERNGQGK